MGSTRSGPTTSATRSRSSSSVRQAPTRRSTATSPIWARRCARPSSTRASTTSSRRRRFGRPPQPARRDQFVVFIQNHDQVGNRPGGERLGHRITFPRQKLAAATVLLSPFVPLIFMGEEYGEPNPFLYFTHHDDPALVEAVRAGRRRPSHSGTDDAAPDPQDVATFERSKVQPELHREGGASGAPRLLPRAADPTPVHPGADRPAASREVIAREDERVVILHARGDAAETIAILGFADTETRVSLPIPAGDWVKRLDAGDPRFLGDGAVIPDRLHSDGTIELDPATARRLLFERTH